MNQTGTVIADVVEPSERIVPQPAVVRSVPLDADDWILLYNEVLPHTPRLYQVLRRVVDLAGAMAILLILSPVMLLISLLICVDSPGMPFFRQLRRGRNQVPFYIYKFRTMYKDAHAHRSRLADQNEMNGIIFKIKQDPRITRIGRFLRKYSLDELPQLFNVVRGEMSLVGPRPFPLEDFEAGSVDHPWFHSWVAERHQVMPGLTGLWQVSGRNNLPFEELMRLDLVYVRYSNPVIDGIILLKTFDVVFSQHGAY